MKVMLPAVPRTYTSNGAQQRWIANSQADTFTRFGALDPRVKQAIQRGEVNKDRVDFVPTPPAVIHQMLSEADVKPGQKVLEPSAGQGNLAEACRRQLGPNATVDVIELQNVFQEILRERGFNIVARDILAYKPGPIYDRIVMNPPYGLGRDVTHVIHSFSLLKPGGKLVAVLPANAFRIEKNPDQRWFSSKSGMQLSADISNFFLANPEVQDFKMLTVPPLSFMQSDIQVPVDTKIVVLTKQSMTTEKP